MENESMFNLISHIKPTKNNPGTSENLLPPIISKKGLTFIDWNTSDSNAVNKYLCFLIKTYLYNHFKNTKKKVINNNPKYKYLGDFNLDAKPLIAIFDNFISFNDFYLNDLENENSFKLIFKLQEANNLTFYCSLIKTFETDFNLLKNIELAIIYLEENYLKKFLKFLTRKNFDFLIIIVTYNIHPLIRDFKNEFKEINFLKINDAYDNYIQVKHFDKAYGKIKNYKLIV